MDRAYRGRVRDKKLATRKGEVFLSIQDLSDRLDKSFTKEDIKKLVSEEASLPRLLTSKTDNRREAMIWGYLTSLAAERSLLPLQIQARDYAGLELSRGMLVLSGGGDHIGEGMSGGVIASEGTGDYLGQSMRGGGIVALSCADYAFRKMGGGWGVIFGSAGNYLGLGNDGGRIVVKGDVGCRAGWLMCRGRLRIGGDAGEYLGLMMKGGHISLQGKAGARAGWRMRGGTITAGEYGPHAMEDASGGRALRREDI